MAETITAAAAVEAAPEKLLSQQGDNVGRRRVQHSHNLLSSICNDWVVKSWNKLAIRWVSNVCLFIKILKLASGSVLMRVIQDRDLFYLLFPV